LPAAAGDETIDSSDTRSERFLNGKSVKRSGPRSVERSKVTRTVIRKGIQRSPHGINHSAQQLFSDADGGLRAPGHDPVAISYSTQSLQGHGEHIRPAESDNFAGGDMPLRIHYLATLSHTAERAFRFDQVADRLGDPAEPSGGRAQIKILEIRS
jgi:hypothetical protein